MKHRQFQDLGCTSHRMAALFIAACMMLIEGKAGANGLEIGVSSTSSVVPARVTLTASASAGGDPIVAYDWKTLDVAPRCRISHCTLDIEIASCRYVELEATTRLGDSLTATKTVCLGDEHGRPPQAKFTFRDRLTAVSSAVATTDPIAIVRRWLDEEAYSGDVISVPNDGACHAIDLLVADVNGRIALDRRSVCTSSASPMLWIGARPSAFSISDQKMKLCGEGVDPLGGVLEETSGTFLLGQCSPDMDPPASLSRQTIRAKRAGGPESRASLFFARAPSTKPRTLLFADLPEMPTAVEGEAISTELDIYGGVGPYTITATLALISGPRIPVMVEAGMDPKRARVQLPALETTGKHRLDVTVRDLRGLEGRASTSVEITARPDGSPDGGTSSDAGNPPGGGKGCGGTLVAPAPRFPLIEIALVLSAAIALRRKGRR